ncbi:ribosome small subunit-dependent GTPase A [Dermatophilus congolensis]|uniref:ribosome small subunit-dependent GTPase A n=1 Tax=Dermatophilus congolensis TaxID=1863 RepID=UPI001AB00A04|nr:ribosome small subunit-dependent GTPase A [Dermatophilus congolensis]MBO3143072.1 ribosome small subunit-dependent GTPase A [Dermatophilus congolensis]MBO3152061.1 ribosome small subunit-dependent GTPase A [Dermatophilus congolensis]MBO3160927.1 ribosome small subunit-dependent GTPase A [Dermatophilus congolensis]MBO3163347.1 ribosome small subunit-dependent GTPase A [Dermatophilus congolensis]MBO3176900.1 ribosome small subunit-dependent GTPase A [Dermatophilus congolensis]
MSSRRALHDRYDESHARIRPNRKGTRPRTKNRPKHADAVIARVVRVDRGRFTCILDGVTVTAMKARELGRHSVVVGDEVALVGDVSGAEGTLARIVRAEPRRTLLRRTADDTDPVERIIVANVDIMVIVTAIADPEPRHRLIDRCLVAAYDAGIHPILVVTKTDLADPSEFLASFAALDVDVITSGRSDSSPISSDSCALDPAAVEAIRHRLAGHASVLVGHSGVGKSTLVNALVPGLGRTTGHVNEVTGRGRHTSTSAIAAPLPDDDGWIVDTPGIRSFGLAHVHPEQIISHFPDLEPGTDGCPRGCSHDEPDCALDEHVANHPNAELHASLEARLDSVRRLLRARRGESDPPTESTPRP